MKRKVYLLLATLVLHSILPMQTVAYQPTENYISRLQGKAGSDEEKVITTLKHFPQVEGVNPTPETINKYYSFVYNKSRQCNLDPDLLLAICSVSFNDFGSSFSETGYKFNNFLDLVIPQLVHNIERYNGDCKMAVEALLQGTEKIDLLYVMYGDDWDKYLNEAAKLDGSYYQEGFVQASNKVSYYSQVCSYYHKNYK